MEPVGFFGIIKLSAQIVRRNLKLFLCLSSLLAILDALLLASTPLSGNSILSLKSVIAGHGNLPSYAPSPQPQGLPAGLLFLNLFVGIAISLLTNIMIIEPVLTFSMYRAVLGKSVDFKVSLQAIPRSARNIFLTALCMFGVMFGLYVAASIPMVITAAVLLAMGKEGMIMVLVLIWGAVVVAGAVYVMGVQWSLAKTVAIVEEKRGWEAIKRSMHLVDGSKWVVVRLEMATMVCIMIVQGAVGAYEQRSVVWRWTCILVSSSLEAMIGLFGMTCIVVLYMSCKARWKEPLDDLIPLSSKFGSAQETASSAKYMDLEGARVDTL